MHRREISHIVKTDSLSKTQLIRQSQIVCLLSIERNLCKNKRKINNVLLKHSAKARVETKDLNYLITSFVLNKHVNV